MRKTLEYGMVFTVGAVGYALIEILWRGRTHWTMVLTGGACLALIYNTEKCYREAPRWKRCIVGAEVITLFELLVGFLANILLGLAVWDYSNQPLNLFGQICPLYCLLWFLLCIPVTRFCAWFGAVMENIFHTEKIEKKRLSM